MTNKLYSAILAGTAVLAVSLGATSANAATATGDATANIVQPVTILQGTVLNFGMLVPSALAGSVDVTFGGARTCNANVTCVGTGAAAAGSFTVSGYANQTVTFAVSAPTTLTGPGTAMALSGLTPSAASASTGAGGSVVFTVGGTLTVGANQAAGVYNGTYTVTADYQ